jgi:hypothetical protein
VPAWPLLERELETVIAAVNDAAAQHRGGLPAFPIDDLIASGMRSRSDYWAELAVAWAEQTATSERVREAAAELMSRRRAPQNLRHRARRIAKA